VLGTKENRNEMKFSEHTRTLIASGIIAAASAVRAEEAATPLLTALSTTTLSGYVDTSAHWNLGTGNLNLPGYTPNGVPAGSKADGFNLDVVALTLNRPAEPDGKWSAGYNATLLFGPDAVGYNPSGTTPGDFSLKDTYVELRAPVGSGLDFKLGTYTEVLGYEVFEAGNNPNYTRSYGYMAEPTQMTGLLVAYQFSPVVSANFSICDAWSVGVNARSFPPSGNKAESFKTYMGSVTLTAPKNFGFLAGSTLLGGVITGYDAVNAVNKTSWYLGGTFNTPIKSLKVGLAHDYVMLAPNTIAGGGTVFNQSGYQHASAVYLLWQATEKLTVNTRADYFMQSGYLVGTTAGFGLPKRAFGLTETIQYDLWKNVQTRAEFRWDHAADGSDPYMTAAGRDNAYLAALNVIYKF